MYEWSKGIMEKIANANCLDRKELCMVETALRTSEIHDQIMNESIDVSKDDRYELQYKITRSDRKHMKG